MSNGSGWPLRRGASASAAGAGASGATFALGAAVPGSRPLNSDDPYRRSSALSFVFVRAESSAARLAYASSAVSCFAASAGITMFLAAKAELRADCCTAKRTDCDATTSRFSGASADAGAGDPERGSAASRSVCSCSCRTAAARLLAPPPKSAACRCRKARRSGVSAGGHASAA